jgi:hypothetical protein
MNLKILPGLFAVCRLDPDAPTPAWLPSKGFINLTRTEAELSIICSQTAVPQGVQSEDGWAAVEVEGPLDFSLTGILASLAIPLAEAGVSLFAVSTYDTDYILVKQAQLEAARRAWAAAGHKLESGSD